MLGSYAWARCFGLEPLPSVISSLIYGFGALFLGQTQALNIIHIMALLPVSLTFIHLGAARQSKIFWFCLAAVWTWQLFAGHFETFAICQICCWIYILWLSLTNNVLLAISKRKIIVFSLLTLFTVSMGAVQLLSTYEFVCKSSRNEVIPLEWIRNNNSALSEPIRFIDPFHPIHKSSLLSAGNASGHVLDKFCLDNNRQYVGLLALLLYFCSSSNWQAAVDGQPSEIRLTNLSMQSVFVPKGEA